MAASGEDRAEPRFEAETAAAAIAAVGSRREGLTDREAGARLQRFGKNLLPGPAGRSALVRLASQFNNLLIYVLIAAAVISGLIGEWIDAVVIMAVVIVNAFIGFFQETRAQRALEALGQLLAVNAIAFREGAKRTVPAAELVPGDIIFLQSGDKVPADARLIEASGLTVDEAVLTGESFAVAKSPEPVAAGLPLGDRTSMLFSGTTVAAGQAVAVVTATGNRTEVGRIGRLVERAEDPTTPLLRRLSAMARTLTVTILGLCAVIVVVAKFIGAMELEDILMASVGLAVSAIPEGLPAIVTVALAIGVRRLAQGGALVRQLPAVETLGSVDVICTDKTGTLTRNELVARAAVTADHRYAVTGEGYRPDGEITHRDGRPASAESDRVLGELGLIAALCNDAALRREGNSWLVEGDPLEGGLLVLALKAGLDLTALAAAHPRHGVIPFESDHRYMATLTERDGVPLVLVKGAPERLLQLCQLERSHGGERPIDRHAWEERLAALAADGFRVLAFASARRATSIRFGRDTISENLAMVGLVGFIDPARPEAQAAVADCRRAGIAVKMITGDHAGTALAVAREVGLDISGGVLTGPEIAALDDEALGPAADRVNVFARVDPAHKLRLVKALQNRGRSVAMTGDGVNDTPALRQAGIGVAMGRRGSDAAREVADIVLVDDNFTSIAQAVREGRVVDDNLRKTLGFILPTNAGESLVVIGAMLTGATLPITALQIIWINFVTEVTLSIALAFEPPAPDVMRRPPRRRDVAFLDRRALLRIVYIGTLMGAAATFLFHLVLGQGHTIEMARAVAVNTVVSTEAACLLAIGTPFWRRPDGRLGPNWVLLGMILAVAAVQVLVTQWSMTADWLGMEPLPWAGWGLVLGAGAVVFALTRLGISVADRFVAGPVGTRET